MNILEFAKAARLSTATVSRAFHEPDKVRAATREHVLALAKQLGYYPDPSGRALVKGRHDVLGLVWPLEVEGAESPFAQRTLAALTGELVELDLDLLICPINRNQPATLEHAQRTLRRSRCDAWILLYPRQNDSLIEALRESQKPVVCLLGQLKGSPEWKSVLVDQEHWIRDALGRLKAGGARRVLFLGRRAEELDHAERHAAFLRIAPEFFGLNYSSLPVWPPQEADLDRLLTSGKIDAVVGVDAQAARTALQACRRLKLSVPNRVQIVSIDESPETVQAVPVLAAYRQPIEAVTTCAVELATGRRNRSRKFEALFIPGSSLRA